MNLKKRYYETIPIEYRFDYPKKDLFYQGEVDLNFSKSEASSELLLKNQQLCYLVNKKYDRLLEYLDDVNPFAAQNKKSIWARAVMAAEEELFYKGKVAPTGETEFSDKILYSGLYSHPYERVYTVVNELFYKFFNEKLIKRISVDICLEKEFQEYCNNNFHFFEDHYIETSESDEFFDTFKEYALEFVLLHYTFTEDLFLYIEQEMTSILSYDFDDYLNYIGYYNDDYDDDDDDDDDEVEEYLSDDDLITSIRKEYNGFKEQYLSEIEDKKKCYYQQLKLLLEQTKNQLINNEQFISIRSLRAANIYFRNLYIENKNVMVANDLSYKVLFGHLSLLKNDN